MESKKREMFDKISNVSDKKEGKKKSRDKKCQVSVVLFEPLRCETKNTLKCIVYLQIQSKKLASHW